MRADMFALWGLVCCILIIVAELKPSFKVVGVLGCLLLIPLALLVMSSRVEVQTGQTTTFTETQNITISSSTSVGTGADTEIYSRLYPTFENVVGLLLAGVAIFGSYHYISIMYPKRFNSPAGS